MGISVNKINFHFSILTQKLSLNSCLALLGHSLQSQVPGFFCLYKEFNSKPIPLLIMEMPHNWAALCISFLYQQARVKAHLN